MPQLRIATATNVRRALMANFYSATVGSLIRAGKSLVPLFVNPSFAGELSKIIRRLVRIFKSHPWTVFVLPFLLRSANDERFTGKGSIFDTSVANAGFPQSRPHSTCMSFENPLVLAQESCDGNRLWRGKREVAENAPSGRALVTFRPRGIESLCERLTRGGILILAQPQEIIGSDFPRQPESLRTQANPFARNPLALIVVIADAEMFLKILFCVLEVVLRLRCDHAADSIRTMRAFCVSQTH